MALYAKVDVSYPDDPKVVDAGPMAELAYLRCVLRSRAHLTDGFIDRRLVARWLVGLTGRPEAHMKRLVEVGLVVVVDGGWLIPSHAWERWNPTADQVEQKRKDEAERKASYRKARMSQRDKAGTPDGIRTASDLRDRQPEPEPEPEPELLPNASHGSPKNDGPPTAPPVVEDDGFEEFWQRYPRRNGQRVGKAAARRAWARIPRTKRGDVVRAVDTYASRCGEMPKDAERWLRPGVWDEWLEPDTGPAAPQQSAQRVRIVDGVRQVFIPGSGWAADARPRELADWEA